MMVYAPLISEIVVDLNHLSAAQTHSQSLPSYFYISLCHWASSFQLVAYRPQAWICPCHQSTLRPYLIFLKHDPNQWQTNSSHSSYLSPSSEHRETIGWTSNHTHEHSWSPVSKWGTQIPFLPLVLGGRTFPRRLLRNKPNLDVVHPHFCTPSIGETRF